MLINNHFLNFKIVQMNKAIQKRTTVTPTISVETCWFVRRLRKEGKTTKTKTRILVNPLEDVIWKVRQKR